MSQPTDEQIAKVAESIYRHICKNTEVMHHAFIDSEDQMNEMGEMLCFGTMEEIGQAVYATTSRKVRGYAQDMAERWFHDDFMRHEKEWLAEWAPYKHRHVGYYHEWLERLP